jgi:4-hydroxy-tetrahydrodipicolinate reductase
VSYRVIQWSTGNVGRYSLRAILSHPELELAGVWVHGEKKAGRDAGELCGVAPVGVEATRDADALLEQEADCVVYTATADLRLMEAVDDIVRILRAGKNVVSSSLVSLVHPAHLGPAVQDKLEDACRQGESSLFFSGIDPGFANDVLPLTLSGLCERWSQIRIREIVNYATYDQPEVVLGTMGFGKEMDDLPLLLRPGTLCVAWGGTIRLLAAGLGLELDEITQRYECLPAPRDLGTPMGTIAEGTRAALRFEVSGMVGGEPYSGVAREGPKRGFAGVVPRHGSDRRVTAGCRAGSQEGAQSTHAVACRWTPVRRRLQPGDQSLAGAAVWLHWCRGGHQILAANRAWTLPLGSEKTQYSDRGQDCPQRCVVTDYPLAHDCAEGRPADE